MGKEGLAEYIQMGFVPYNGRGGDNAVSRSLDFAHADFATANAFRVLSAQPGAEWTGKAGQLTQDAGVLETRAHRVYRELFDPASGLMLPRDGNRNPRPGLDPIEWGHGYTEGNAYHHSYIAWPIKELSALHNGGRTTFTPATGSGSGRLSPLINLRGAAAVGGGAGDAGSGVSTVIGTAPDDNLLLQRLHRMMVMPGHFRPGSYGQEIHEMREARAGAMGQYSHNNVSYVYVCMYVCVFVCCIHLLIYIPIPAATVPPHPVHVRAAERPVLDGDPAGPGDDPRLWDRLLLRGRGQRGDGRLVCDDRDGIIQCGPGVCGRGVRPGHSHVRSYPGAAGGWEWEWLTPGRGVQCPAG